ncbi:tetratricopeptide repeat protein [Zhouia sp. PK063]|uniref:tetratricopeptide repeat protein n=1 Tax=Zhouia sp. PK063 TaxID=3373602 RepID=UPI0037A9FD12
MRPTFYISLILLLFSCNSNNEKEIAELFTAVNNNRLLGKKIDAIRDCEKIISLDNSNIDAYRVLSELTFETGDFEKSLELCKKLTELKPDAYQYYSKTGLLLALFDKNKESELYYQKAREVFAKKEQDYWTKTDTLGMATMFMTIGDSIRSKELLKLEIKRKPNDSIYFRVFKEFNNYSYIKTINRLKKVMTESKYTESDNNSESKLIEGDTYLN